MLCDFFKIKGWPASKKYLLATSLFFSLAWNHYLCDMNMNCLYCFRPLAAGEVDYHAECAADFFGAEGQSLPEGYVVRERDNVVEYTPEEEAVTFRLARAAMILTQGSLLVRCGQSGALGFAVRRDDSVERIDELVARLEGCEFDGSYEMIAEMVEDFSSISRLDVVNLYEQIIFGWIVGCNSMTLNSFGLSHPNAGVCSLAPIARMIPLLAVAGGDELALDICGKRRNIHRSDFERSMRSMGLKDRIIRITIEKMISAKESWFELIDLAPLSEERKQQLKTQISARLEVLGRKN